MELSELLMNKIQLCISYLCLTTSRQKPRDACPMIFSTESQWYFQCQEGKKAKLRIISVNSDAVFWSFSCRC